MWPSQPIWLPALSEAAGPVRLAELMQQVRAAIAAHEGSWQDVIDALRPHVPSLWQRMPTRDKRLFLRQVARYWEVHRHRVSPATAGRIAELRRTGSEQNGVKAELTVGWLINGTGPATDITGAADPLLCDLLGHGLVRPDPLRLGIDADPDGAVLDRAGRPSSTIFTLGPPLRGLSCLGGRALPHLGHQGG